MNIAISGATGFIGGKLCSFLTERGDVVTPLGRTLFDDEHRGDLQKKIEQADVVINLSGEPILCHWSRENRERILASRVITTRLLVNAINRAPRPTLLISASAIDYYPTRGRHSEDSYECGRGFLYEVIRAWEEEALKLRFSCRLVIARLGIVFDREQGAFPAISMGRYLHISTTIGSLKRHISWIDIDDLLRATALVIDNEQLHGVVNIVAPRPTPYKELIAALRLRYSIWLTIPIPKLALWMIYGGAAQVVYNNHSIYPKRLAENGFEYQSPDIESFINRISST
ncbi:MAG: DUF1731 domain-containing protein [Rikenellaceae bacterium]